VPLRAAEAEAHLADHVGWDDGSPPTPDAVDRFVELVAGAARPIDDHRGSADYRHHAVGVLARRALHRAFPGGDR
jgi:CO/xanthine dehydrogenase FAD-binding subunit